MLKAMSLIRKISRYIEKRRRRAYEWRLVIEPDHIFLGIPRCYSGFNHRKDLGRLDAKAIAHFKEYWQHTYMYVQSGFEFDTLTNLFEESAMVSKGARFYECPDMTLLKDFLSGRRAYETAIFILDEKPDNWRNIIVRLIKIMDEIDEGHDINEYMDELKHCLFASYTIDLDLMIRKIDLPEDTIISILKDVAAEEGLELIVEHRQRHR